MGALLNWWERSLLSNIQILRALAAFGVVVFHTGYHVPGWPRTDFLGVATFFVISGFIMSYIGPRQTAPAFLKNRIIRIVPLYWLGTCTFAALIIWVYPLLGKTPESAVSSFSLLQDLFFIPHFSENETLVYPLMNVGWTLNLEMFFYTIFWLMLFISQSWAPVLSGAILTTIWLCARIFNLGPMISFLGHDYVIYFVLGICSFYLWDRGPKFSSSVGWVCLLCGAAAVLFATRSSTELAAKVAPFLIVYGALVLESSGYICSLRIPLLIGAASYALYLFHPFVLGLLNKLPSRFPLMDMSKQKLVALLAVTICSIVAVVIHLLIERPILSLKRRQGALQLEQSR